MCLFKSKTKPQRKHFFDLIELKEKQSHPPPTLSQHFAPPCSLKNAMYVRDVNNLHRRCVFLHELLHVIPDDGDGFDGLVIVHGDTDDVVAEAEGVAADVEPAEVIISLAEELLDEGDVGVGGSGADGEHHLHAAAEFHVSHKCAVEALRGVNQVIQEVRAFDGEGLVVRDAALLDHILADHRTEPHACEHRHVVDLVGRFLEFYPVAHRRHSLHLILPRDQVLANDGVANPKC